MTCECTRIRIMCRRLKVALLWSLLATLITAPILSGGSQQRLSPPAVQVLNKELERPYPSAKTGGNYMHNYYLPPAGTSSPWWPSWSPDGRWLAYSMQGSLWKSHIGESAAYEIAHSEKYLSSPGWSPQGRWIAFTADDGSAINLKLLDLETGRQSDLTSGPHLNLDPAWSPDGSRLAFVSTRPSGYFNIFIMEIDQGKPGSVVQLTRDHRHEKNRLYFGENDLHIQPTWSPEGRELIFVCNRGIPLGSGAVWRMPAVANGIDQVRLIRQEETLYRTRPDWSPDGKRILYSSHLGGQFNQLFVLPAQGGEPYKLTFGKWDAFHPRWSPDGEWILYLSNQDGLPQLRLLKTFGGTEKRMEITSRTWSRPMGRVRIRVEDSATKETLAARLYIRASDGKSYAPNDAFQRVGRTLLDRYFHTTGVCEIEVPEGELTLSVAKGLEYHPQAIRLQVRPGTLTPVTIPIERLSRLKDQGWYSGSNHVHMNYGGNLHNTPENLMFMAEAEDLDVVANLIANKDNRIFDHQFFTGRPHPLSNQRRILYFNEEYRPPFYGHISLINLTRHLISPFTTGYAGTAIDSLYPSNTDMIRVARAQGALAAYVHPWGGNSDPLETNLGGAKALPVDLALGTIDYHELMTTSSWAAMRVWHHALNNGFRLAAVGGEDSINNLHKTGILGQSRSYTYLGPALDWDAWVKAIRKGHSFVTNAPLLQLQIEGKIPGEELQLSADGGTVVIKGKVESIVPLDRVELVIHGRRLLVAESSAFERAGAGIRHRFEKSVRIDDSAWITLQAYGNHPVRPINDRFPLATTNPVWVSVGGRAVRSRESARYFIRWIDKLTTMADSHPGWRSDKERTHVLRQFRQAREVYVNLENEAGE